MYVSLHNYFGYRNELKKPQKHELENGIVSLEIESQYMIFLTNIQKHFIFAREIII